jgi:hypothetical protein
MRVICTKVKTCIVGGWLPDWRDSSRVRRGGSKHSKDLSHQLSLNIRRYEISRNRWLPLDRSACDLALVPVPVITLLLPKHCRQFHSAAVQV